MYIGMGIIGIRYISISITLFALISDFQVCEDKHAEDNN